MTDRQAISVLECMAIDMTGALGEMSERDPITDVIRQRLDAIDAAQASLQAKVEAEKNEPLTGWISVKNRLPGWLEKCLCSVIIPEDGGGYSRDFRILCISEFKSSNWNCKNAIVTHWMPLPEPPDDIPV